MSTDIALWTHKIGTPIFFFLFSIGVSLFFFIIGKPGDGIIFLLGLITVSGFVGLLKMLFRVARPLDAMFDISSGAFPSGHAAGIAFLMVGLLFVLQDLISPALHVGLGIILGACVVLVSWSRVAIRVHTPFQVLIGLVIGFAMSLSIFMYQETILSFLLRF